MKDKLKNLYKEGLKTKNSFLKNTTQMTLSTIQNEEIKLQRELTDNELITNIKKQIKQKQKAIQLYTDGNRLDLKELTEKEIELLETLIPQMADEVETTEIINKLIKEGEENQGMIIKKTRDTLGVRADGAMISYLVNAILKK